MKMPFGKHRGVAIEELPETYLQWLSELDDLREPLVSAVSAEMRFRSGAQAGKSSITLKVDAADAVVAREIIQAGRRACAVRHHPDAGGNSQKMVAVNTTADRLLAGLGNQ